MTGWVEQIKHPATANDRTSMNIEINTNGELIITNNYVGIGIQTDDGLFGIAQRDAGIEVMLDGHHVWSSDDRPPIHPVTFAVAREAMAAGLRDDDGTYTAYHANVSMMIYDNSGLDAADSNEIAAKILNLMFDLQSKPGPADLAVPPHPSVRECTVEG